MYKIINTFCISWLEVKVLFLELQVFESLHAVL